MVAAQTLLGTDNSTKGKKIETTIHHAKQPQLSVSLLPVFHQFPQLAQGSSALKEEKR
jgi:hypothetical protein